ncbi:MAG: 3-oxoacyl-ACP reductase FabG [Anaerolineales bacterium]|nr:3-oxoacyl-ACP reductase FabG [Anaerolineales bacterium]
MMQGKVAIITGASGGIGQVLAAELGEAGASIVVHYLTNEEAASRLVSKIREDGGKAMKSRADVTNSSEVESMVHRALDTFGRIDILVNNAGINRDAISWKMDERAWSQVLGVNLTGAFLCAKTVLPAMRRQQWGRIINISSVVAQIGVPGAAAYAASKAGLIGLTKTLAREVVRNNITVNCLALGYFSAGLMLTLAPELQETILSHIPMRRLGQPEEVAHTVRFLCDERASYITGQVLSINGGLYM